MKAIRVFPKSAIDGSEYEARRGNSTMMYIDDPKEVEVPTPECSGRNEVLIEPNYVGLCGTDYMLVSRDGTGACLFRGPIRPPVTLGHEILGTVIDSGTAAGLSVGDFVVCNSIVTCGTCWACSRGYPNSCSHIELVGLTRDGGLADRLVLPSNCVHNVSDIVTSADNLEASRHLCLYELFCCAYNALYTVWQAIARHGTVHIYGGGYLGQALAMTLRSRNIGDVTIFDSRPERIRILRKSLEGVRIVYMPLSRRDAWDESAKVGARIISSEVLDPLARLHQMVPGSIVLFMIRTTGTLNTDLLVDNNIQLSGVRGNAGESIARSVLDDIRSGVLPIHTFGSQILCRNDVVRRLCESPDSASFEKQIVSMS